MGIIVISKMGYYKEKCALFLSDLYDVLEGRDLHKFASMFNHDCTMDTLPRDFLKIMRNLKVSTNNNQLKPKEEEKDIAQCVVMDIDDENLMSFGVKNTIVRLHSTFDIIQQNMCDQVMLYGDEEKII